MRTRFSGPFRQEWYSICSRHQHYSASCGLCQTGQWRNVWRQAAGSWVYDRSPALWRLWANRPHWNGSRTFLEDTFPRLRSAPRQLSLWGRIVESARYFALGLERFLEWRLFELMSRLDDALDGIGSVDIEGV